MDARGIRGLVFALATLFLAPRCVCAQALAGSVASLDAQNEQAILNDFSFLATRADVARFAKAGYLERIPGGPNYVLHDVSYPLARHEVRVFIDRLASQYRHACNEKLVVTSLTRPIAEQPDNASPRSVHPTGMAVDLRLPARSACQAWLERTLLSLETRGVLDVTREHWPPHLHVALFPQRYASYVALLTRASTAANATLKHTVRAAETLWGIAKQFGISVGALRATNALISDVIRQGQVLVIPARPDRGD